MLAADQRVERGVADGLAASGHVLRELLLRHGVPMHHLGADHAGRLRAVPRRACLPHRRRRRRGRGRQQSHGGGPGRHPTAHGRRQLASRGLHGRRRLSRAGRQARGGLRRAARRPDGHACSADWRDARGPDRSDRLHRRRSAPPGQDRRCRGHRDRGLRAAPEPSGRCVQAHRHVPPGQLHPDDRPRHGLAGQRVRAAVRQRRQERPLRALLLDGMTTATPSLRRLTPPAAGLLLLAAVAWLATVGQAAAMHGMTGAMGLGLAAFVGMWALMMAAMMLPSVAPVASMYQRSVRSYRALRLAGFATGGVYQLTPLKSRCLRHCRSPLSLLLHYGAYRGRLRDVRAGAHHAAYCLGCCWSLMALFVALGLMNLAAMVALAVVVLVEKLWVHGEVLARAVGVAALVLAVAAIWLPALAPGLHDTSRMMSMAGS